MAGQVSLRVPDYPLGAVADWDFENPLGLGSNSGMGQGSWCECGYGKTRTRPALYTSCCVHTLKINRLTSILSTEDEGFGL